MKGQGIYLMELAGPAYERGLAHGRAVPEMVRLAVANWGDVSRADPVQVEALLRRLEDNVAAVHPDALEEIRGLAEGSGVAYEDLLKLNFCEALWNDTTGWCTNVCFLRTPRGPVLGKNSDLWEHDDDFHLVQRIRPDRGYPVLRCGFGGYVGAACGINGAGLAFGGSSVKVLPGTGHPEGVPVEIVVDRVLQYCATVPEAIHTCAEMSLASQAANLTFVDRSGNGAIVEKAPSGQVVRPPIDDVLFHTNHFLALSAPEERLDDEAFQSNSRRRMASLSQLLPGVERSPEGMKSILRDHSEAGPICQHGDADLHSQVSHVLLPVEGRMWVAEGYPCQSEYHEFRLEV
jgi:isopenicillin-N N-acyltransferase-like protein